MLLVMTFDIWIAAPFFAWLIAYVGILCYLLPRLHRVAEQQADARSTMPGRVVDSYTNIMTVKLFAHAGREEAYARESMDGFMNTVYRMMRLTPGSRSRSSASTRCYCSRSVLSRCGRG